MRDSGLDVPDRTVVHDVEADDFDTAGGLGGEAQALPMSPAAKAAARRRRDRLYTLGGFGFQSPPAA